MAAAVPVDQTCDAAKEAPLRRWARNCSAAQSAQRVAASAALCRRIRLNRAAEEGSIFGAAVQGIKRSALTLHLAAGHALSSAFEPHLPG